jgi:hypothetical protein
MSHPIKAVHETGRVDASFDQRMAWLGMAVDAYCNLKLLATVTQATCSRDSKLLMFRHTLGPRHDALDRIMMITKL